MIIGLRNYWLFELLYAIRMEQCDCTMATIGSKKRLKPGVVCVYVAIMICEVTTESPINTFMSQVYFGSLPPFMKPQKLRHLLQQHGDVTKLYLVPEGMQQHALNYTASS